MIGDLYIVATPIGNLGDFTIRAVETLKFVDLILCEDTRKTSVLLRHYEIDRPTLSYHQQSTDDKKAHILSKLMEGKNIALVTDAGTPGVADPGNELIAYLLYHLPDLKIIPIPGASSLTAALSISGMNVSKFTFIGFLPKKGKDKMFLKLLEQKIPIVFYESPNRIIKTLDWLIKLVGQDKQIFIGQELTKMYERILRGNLLEVKEKLMIEQNSQAGRVRGELVVIIS
ncbi:MAG: 16S rRNA (cytidine(1402)-2'-O)-methyltransferase [Patescibacteria group bacterium]